MAYTTINKSTDYFNTKLYTGNGSEDNTISGIGFQSDLTWLKSRSSAISHMWTDAVRGNNKVINSNTSDAETTFSSLKSWNADGFVLSNNSNFNGNGVNFASWNWLANGAGSANTDGTINSTVSANTTSGFSVVKYTAGSSGANSDTIGHGLGVIPQMIILKTTTATDSWVVYHHSNGAGKSMVLNNNTAVATNSNIFPTTPTSSVFYPGNTATTNSSSRSYIAYCFTEKQGYSKFGSYTGNGNADGTFIYTGFKPAFTIIKNISATARWVIDDKKRSLTNEMNNTLFADGSEFEYTGGAYGIDYLSNGFKLYTTSANYNTSGQTYIYMAFAEAPLVGSNNVPCTAR